MRGHSRELWLAASFGAIATCASAACGTTEDARESESTTDVQGTNGLTRNGLTRNGLTRNGLTRNGNQGGGATQDIAAAALNGASFTSDDPETTIKFLSYAVSCALPSGSSASISVNGTSSTYQGALGLAGGWRNAPCDGSCQRWVTSCLLARTNYYGTQVPISIRASTLPSTLTERLTYSLQEGAYFGNIFGDDIELYACAGSMFDTLGIGAELGRLQRRVCADESFEDCPMHVVGPCRNFLLPPWTLTNERSCTTQDGAGALGDCRDAMGTPSFPPSATAYSEVTTIFLNPLTPVWWLLE